MRASTAVVLAAAMLAPACTSQKDSAGDSGSAPSEDAEQGSDAAMQVDGHPGMDAPTEEPAEAGDATTSDVADSGTTADGNGGPVDAATSDGPSSADAQDGGPTSDGAADGGMPTSFGTLCGGICQAGWSVCNTQPANQAGGHQAGCVPNSACCGGCSLPNATATCSGGHCAVAQCAPGFADCDSNPANGCEANLESTSSCGSCGVSCGSGATLCSPQGCVSACSPPTTLCGSACVNLVSDPQNCGGCNQVCTSAVGGLACVNAKCANGAPPTCVTGLTDCGGTCVDLQTDLASCGACGVTCSPAGNGGQAVCFSGQCIQSCMPGWTLVAGACQPPAARSPQWLATGLSSPDALVADDVSVYWIDDGDGSIKSVPVSGGATASLAQSQAKPTRIAVDSTNVYWTNNLGGAVMFAPKDGSGQPTVLASANMPYGIVALGGTVYWTNTGKDAAGQYDIESVSGTGGTPSTLVASAQTTPTELITDGANVFYLGSGILSHPLKSRRRFG